MRILKIAGIGAGVVVGLAAVGVVGLYAWSNGELKTTVALPTHDFVAPTDSAAVARGEHVVRVLAKCVDCHGQDLGGATLVDNVPIGLLAGPNLTPHATGIGGSYSDADWERAIRHGLAKDGRRLLVMPSMDYQYLSDEDVGAIVAYLRTVAPVDRPKPELRLGPLARALFAAGQMPLFPSEAVRHRDERVAQVPEDSTVEYGKYLGDVGCAGCHGMQYQGGKIPGAPPDWPMSANLTPTGIGHYSYEDFRRALTEGVRPGGTALNPVMPVAATKLMTETEFVALWKYFRTLPPKDFGAAN